MSARLPTDTVVDLEAMMLREWIDTNGVGGYAAGTSLDCHTRKYHGLLVTRMPWTRDGQPTRAVLVSKSEDSVLIDGQERFLSTHKFPGGVFHPVGWQYLREFSDALYPVWQFEIGALKVRRSLMMLPGEETTLVRYDVSGRVKGPVTLRVRPMLAYRGHHDLARENMDIRSRTAPIPGGFRIAPYEGMPDLQVTTRADAAFFPAPDWSRNVEYRNEQERGYAYQEDLFCPGVFEKELSSGDFVIFRYSTRSEAPTAPLGDLWAAEETRRKDLVASRPRGKVAEPQRLLRLRRLVRQFSELVDGRELTMVGGFPWIFESTREIAMAIPGYCRAVGLERKGDALALLTSLGRHVSERTGLLPVALPPAGVEPAWVSADSALWWIWAAQHWVTWSRDADAARDKILPVIRRVVDAVIEGRCPLLNVMPNGLLSVPSSRVGLTWMNSSVWGMPVVPRQGALVEINALWYNALSFGLALARDAELPLDERWIGAARGARDSFRGEFWVDAPNGDGFLADGVNADGRDEACRPNQIVAAAVTYSPLAPRDIAAVTRHVERELVTPVGLRTLSPEDSRYRPHVRGDQVSRDVSMHQGGAWPWMVGMFVDAALRVSSDRTAEAQRLLALFAPLMEQASAPGGTGVGLMPEMFDGAPPHRPDGCFAHGPGAAEIVRAWECLREGERRRVSRDV